MNCVIYRVFGVVLLLMGSTVSLASSNDIQPTLSVQGQAKVKVPADQVNVRVGVETVANTADRALDENSRIMAAVRKELSKAGVETTELETGSFSIQPRWQPRPANVRHDWKPSIVGYVVTNFLNIKSQQLGKVGQWISVATEAGANNLGGLQFSLKDPDQHRNRAIEIATQKARGYAASAATAADVQLGSITALRVDGAISIPFVKNSRGLAQMARMEDSSASVITPGDIEVRASVSIDYEIRR